MAMRRHRHEQKNIAMSPDCWSCHACQYRNFSTRSQCRRCGESRFKINPPVLPVNENLLIDAYRALFAIQVPLPPPPPPKLEEKSPLSELIATLIPTYTVTQPYEKLRLDLIG